MKLYLILRKEVLKITHQSSTRGTVGLEGLEDLTPQALNNTIIIPLISTIHIPAI